MLERQDGSGARIAERPQGEKKLSAKKITLGRIVQCHTDIIKYQECEYLSESVGNKLTSCDGQKSTICREIQGVMVD